ncbi:Dynamin-related protein 3A [Capsicum baccatum]|uniref:Dynamin-related protein 3A n=1 Tax=Capsicum baccatum TaxID=33114 RepID=A0A2G2W2T4_CAPBA|nr:Dynamin-related protein 3A [Capsicum baccatum]
MSDSEDFSFIVDTDRLQGGELIKISCACESVEIRRFSELRSRLEDVTARFLRDGVKPVERMITNLIDMEMDYINSSHPNFIGGTKAVDMAQRESKAMQVGRPQSDNDRVAAAGVSTIRTWGITSFFGIRGSCVGNSSKRHVAEVINDTVEKLAEAPPKDDGILRLSSEDSEDDDFNPGDPDKDEPVKTESSSSDFTSDSEDFSFIVDTDRLQGDELIKISCACESVEIRRISKLRSRLEDVTARFLRDSVKPAEIMITNLIDMEMDYINSSHPNFIGGTKAVDMAQSELKAMQLKNPPSVLRPGEAETEYQVEIIVTKILITSYYDIVRRNIQDLVPKAIMHYLVNHAKRNLLGTFIEKLYRENLFEDLLREKDNVVTQRRATAEMCHALRQAVEILEQHIRNVLPTLKTDLTSHLVAVEKKLCSYGEALESKGERGAMLLNILTKYSEAFSAKVDGKSQAMTTKELSGGARIHHIFQSIFVKS